MVMIVTRKIETHNSCFYIDSEQHVPNMTVRDTDYVTNIQADGHELEYIKSMFTNIPMANTRVVKWEGEMARFIARNLR